MAGLEILVLLAMLVGLVGVFVPVLPGLLLILGAGIVWALTGDVGGIGWLVVAVMAVLAALGTAVPYWLTGRRGADAGLPGWVLLAGVVGTVIGFFVIPVVGALIGGPVGIFVAELVRHRTPSIAWRSTWQAIKSLGMGIVLQFAIGVGMIGVWVGGVIAT
ncbi:MAG TPA: DUF456 domain-containing protein [Actinomycetota bacterium]